MNTSSQPQVFYGTWTPSNIDLTVPSYPAPAHWTMSQLDNCPPPPYDHKLDHYQYEDGESIPPHVETFARSMFWWGFRKSLHLYFPSSSCLLTIYPVCPLLWLAGIFLIFSALRAPTTWDQEKTPEQTTRLLCLIREVELRWAWRCAYALSTFAIVATLLSLIIKFSILS